MVWAVAKSLTRSGTYLVKRAKGLAEFLARKPGYRTKYETQDGFLIKATAGGGRAVGLISDLPGRIWVSKQVPVTGPDIRPAAPTYADEMIFLQHELRDWHWNDQFDESPTTTPFVRGSAEGQVPDDIVRWQVDFGASFAEGTQITPARAKQQELCLASCHIYMDRSDERYPFYYSADNIIPGHGLSSYPYPETAFTLVAEVVVGCQAGRIRVADDHLGALAPGWKFGEQYGLFVHFTPYLPNAVADSAADGTVLLVSTTTKRPPGDGVNNFGQAGLYLAAVSPPAGDDPAAIRWEQHIDLSDLVPALAPAPFRGYPVNQWIVRQDAAGYWIGDQLPPGFDITDPALNFTAPYPTFGNCPRVVDRLDAVVHRRLVDEELVETLEVVASVAYVVTADWLNMYPGDLGEQPGGDRHSPWNIGGQSSATSVTMPSTAPFDRYDYWIQCWGVLELSLDMQGNLLASSFSRRDSTAADSLQMARDGVGGGRSAVSWQRDLLLGRITVGDKLVTMYNRMAARRAPYAVGGSGEAEVPQRHPLLEFSSGGWPDIQFGSKAMCLLQSRSLVVEVGGEEVLQSGSFAHAFYYNTVRFAGAPGNWLTTPYAQFSHMPAFVHAYDQVIVSVADGTVIPDEFAVFFVNLEAGVVSMGASTEQELPWQSAGSAPSRDYRLQSTLHTYPSLACSQRGHFDSEQGFTPFAVLFTAQPLLDAPLKVSRSSGLGWENLCANVACSSGAYYAPNEIRFGYRHGTAAVSLPSQETP